MSWGGGSQGQQPLTRSLPPRSEIHEQIWGAGAALAAYFMGPGRSLFSERPDVVELGSGTGVAGMAAAVAGASSVVLTDLENCIPALRGTIAENADALGGCDVRAEVLAWGDAEAVFDVCPTGCDLIIGADLLYDPANFDGLLQTLHELQLMRDARSELCLVASTRPAQRTPAATNPLTPRPSRAPAHLVTTPPRGAALRTTPHAPSAILSTHRNRAAVGESDIRVGGRHRAFAAGTRLR